MEELELISKDKLAEKGIELVLDRTVSVIDPVSRKVFFADGGSFAYDACLAAPGSAARAADIPGADLRGVYCLRSKSDGLRLKLAASEAKNIVLIGSGFIGMEAAAVFAQQKKLVTVVTPDAKPFARVFGDQIAEALLAAHRAAGTAFELEAKVSAIEGKDGHVSGVSLESGMVVPADLVLLGIGAQPRIEMISGTTKSDDGGIIADETLKATDGLWVAGDIASFPSHFASGHHIRIEHWRLAEQLGRHAARAMLGDTAAFSGIPFFWTQQHWQLNLIGSTKSFDDIHIEGDLAGGNFMAYYISGDKVVAGAGAGEGDKTVGLHALYLGGDMPSAQSLSEAGWDLSKLPLAKTLKAA